MFAPGLPVIGSIDVRLFPLLLFTYRVFRSHEGTTCCGSAPVLQWSTICIVVGSITSIVFDSLLGTYTRAGTPATAGLMSFGPMSA